METKLREYINSALKELGVTDTSFVVERPAEMSHGDYSTNVALATAKKLGKNPRAFAEEIKSLLERVEDDDIAAVEIAGPGFINVRCSKSYFIRELGELLQQGVSYGNNETLKHKKVIVEYTDPNPFKEFHIGHLMSNTIGESIARILEASGGETKRACYQGDVGLHVASAVWGMTQEALPDESADIGTKVEFLGRAYARGAQTAKFDDIVKHDIVVLNKKIYDRNDAHVNQLYDLGRAWSLEYFEIIYKRLGTAHNSTEGKAFDFYFFESNTGIFGKEVVHAHPEVFVESDGAIVYKGDEAMGLHTRVFLNKEGLPTYEAKELGLAKIKYDAYPYDHSTVVTGNEINDYFKVLLDAMAQVFPELAAKTEHISHGMMRLTTGKMSSRTGDVISANTLINDTKTTALQKFKAGMFSNEEQDRIAEMVAVGAIKYAILRQATGKDIIFDVEQSLSFEGDSGPYLQYTNARAHSLLEKAGEKKANPEALVGEVSTLHRTLLFFPEVVLRASIEREPHYIVTYLTQLAREFNAYYANTQILGDSPDEPYKLALVSACAQVMERGLALLGIMAPAQM